MPGDNEIEFRVGAQDRASSIFTGLEGRIVALNQAFGLAQQVWGAAAGSLDAFLTPAAEFDRAMNRVSALTRASAEDFAALRDQAKDLGATTQFTATQAGDAMGFLAQAGFDATKILEAMPATLQLAASAQLDLASSADIVSNIMQGYRLEAVETNRATDVLTQAFISSNTNLSQLGEAMKYAGPVAKGMGVDFEEATAILGMFGNAGIQGSMAGTALRGALTDLANPTKEQADLLRDLGVTVFDSSGKMRSMADILTDLEASGTTTTQVMQLFGQRAGPAMQALLDQGSEALRTFTAELEASGGVAERVANTQMRGLIGAGRELDSAMEGLLITLNDFTGAQETSTDVVRGAAVVVRGTEERISELDQTIAAIREGTFNWSTGLDNLATALLFLDPALINIEENTRKTGDSVQAVNERLSEGVDELGAWGSSVEQADAAAQSLDMTLAGNTLTESFAAVTVETNNSRIAAAGYGAQLVALQGIVENLEGALADETGALRAIRLAQALVNTYAGANQALASLPFPANIAAAGTVTAAGLANVQQIRDAEIPSFHGGGVVGPGDGLPVAGDPGGRLVVAQVGERFLAPGAGGGGGVSIGTLQVSVLENATNAGALLSMDQGDWRRVVAERIIPALDELARQGQRPQFVDSNV